MSEQNLDGNDNLDLPMDDFGSMSDLGTMGGMDNYGGFGDESTAAKYSDLLKDLTNFDPAIQRRIRNWLGLEWDEETEKYIQKKEAIINLRGAHWASGYLGTYQTKTNFITNINEREFTNLQLDIIKMCWLIFPTHEDFAVKRESDWYRLCMELEHSAFLVLAGAGDGKYTKFFGESVHRTENVSLSSGGRNHPHGSAPPQGGGWFDNLKSKVLGR